MKGKPYDLKHGVGCLCRHKVQHGHWDLGVIYYAYPNAFNPGLDLPYFELKAAVSTEVWKGGPVGVSVFYSPDYQPY